jgi:hypothetical protein
MNFLLLLALRMSKGSIYGSKKPARDFWLGVLPEQKCRAILFLARIFSVPPRLKPGTPGGW